MKKYVFALIFLTTYNSNAFALNYNRWLFNLFDQVTRTIGNFSNQQIPCPKLNKFETNNQMIEALCSESKNLDIKQLRNYLKLRGAEEILNKQEVSFEKFFENFIFFHKQNTNIPNLVDDILKNKWSFTKPTEKDFNHWKSKMRNDSSFMPLHKVETANGEVSFVAATHLYTIRDEGDIKAAKEELLGHFNKVKPSAIIVEGFEIGQEMPCEYVLSKALKPDEIINSESSLSVKVAFNRKIAIIPGDGQSIDEVDERLQSEYNKEELAEIKEKLKLLDFLHSYYSNLIKQSVNDPINTTISQLNQQGVLVSTDEILSLYKELNKRGLPHLAKEIYKDFTPPGDLATPRGTNFLVSIQDKFRNQGLVSAAQMGLLNYGETMIIYGSGHLPEVAPSLTKTSQ